MVETQNCVVVNEMKNASQTRTTKYAPLGNIITRVKERKLARS